MLKAKESIILTIISVQTTFELLQLAL